MPFVDLLRRSYSVAAIADYESVSTMGVSWSTHSLTGIGPIPGPFVGSAPVRTTETADVIACTFTGSDLPSDSVAAILPPLRFTCEEPSTDGDAWNFPPAQVAADLEWLVTRGALDVWLPSSGSHVTTAPPNQLFLDWQPATAGGLGYDSRVSPYSTTDDVRPFVSALEYDVHGYGWDKAAPNYVRNFHVLPALLRVTKNGVDQLGLIDRRTIIANAETVANNNLGVTDHHARQLLASPTDILLEQKPRIVFETWPEPDLFGPGASPYGGSYASARTSSPPTWSAGDTWAVDVWLSVAISNPTSGRNSALTTHRSGAWAFSVCYPSNQSGPDAASPGWDYPGELQIFGQLFNDGFDPDSDTYSVEFPSGYPWHIGDGSTGAHKLVADPAIGQTCTIDSRGIRAAGTVQSGDHAGEPWDLSLWWTGEIVYIALTGPSDELPPLGEPLSHTPFTQRYRPDSDSSYVDTWDHPGPGTLLNDPCGRFAKSGSTDFLPWYDLSDSPRDPAPLPLPWPSTITTARTVQ